MAENEVTYKQVLEVFDDRGSFQERCEILAVGRLEENIGNVCDLGHDRERRRNGGIVGCFGE